MEKLYVRDKFGGFYFVNLTRIIVDLSLGAFFSIFIYRVTGSVELTIIGYAVMYLGIFLGYLSTIFLVPRLRYYELAKLSFLISATIYFLGVLLFDHLQLLIFPILLGISISNGMYWTGKNMYDLHLFSPQELHPIWFKLFGFTQVIGVILPFLTGLLIKASGYDLVLLFAATIYFVGVILPIQIKEGKRDLFDRKQVARLMKHRNFKVFLAYTFFDHIVVIIRNFAFILTPFFFLSQNELELGALTSGVAIASGVAAYMVRNIDDKKGYQLATVGAVNFGITDGLFAFFWSQGVMVFRSLVNPFASSFFDPEVTDLDYKIKRDLLGDHVVDDAYELQITQEVVFLFARVGGAAVFLLLLKLVGDYMSLARFVIAFTAIWPFVYIRGRILLRNWIEGRY